MQLAKNLPKTFQTINKETIYLRTLILCKCLCMNTVLKIGLQTDKRMMTICEYLKILKTVNELDRTLYKQTSQVL